MKPVKLFFTLLTLALALALASNATLAADREPMVVKVEGNGQVTSKPGGIACPTDCFENYREKITVTLTATPQAGGKFLGWSGDCSGMDPVCRVKIKKSRRISASFSGESADEQ